ncbi:cytosine permease [Acidocella sp.]|jgi:purine-cytosine permease-like protein|uniref:purine-cytosine permease family protein n=1 Tax=Acidocella sp. TaxID=50710 RepID=UPI00261F1972|nr:cytosine permease [Acidocella sp.]
MVTLADTEAQGVRNGPSLGIETRSIDYVPQTERHGKVSAQGPFWFLGNFQFFTIAIGFIGPGMGLGLGATALASALGILFGTLFMAFHASQGPDLGLPQMIQSRAQFGYRGVILPLIGTLFTFAGFNVVDTVLISQGLNHLFGWGIPAVAVGLGIIAAIIAIFGHDWLHIIFRVLFWISLPLYLIITAAIMLGKITPEAAAHTSFTWVAFAAQFAACASYNITYAPYVSDYTRYLPGGQGRSALVWNVYIGASASAIWLTILGAWLATYFGASDGMVATNAAGNAVLPHLGTLTVLVSVAALTATMGLNAYSGMLTLITGLDCFLNIPFSRAVRVLGVLALAVIWLAVSLPLNANAINALYDALSVMLYLLVPWTAVNLMDYFFVRKGHYAIKDFFTAGGIYGAWGWRGLAAYLIGFAASVPFFNLAGVFEGPIAHMLGDVDISWAPGLLVSGLAYYLITRSLDLSAERPAIIASDEAFGLKL